MSYTRERPAAYVLVARVTHVATGAEGACHTSRDDVCTKRCHVCEAVLPLADFPPDRARADGRQSMCRSCYSAYQREYHGRRSAEDPEYRRRVSRAKRDRASSVRRENHVRLLEFFAAHPCVDCGEDDHVVLTVDHVRGSKRFTIADRLHSMRWERLRDEIEKCGVVCANCHMRRTARRAGHYRGLA